MYQYISLLLILWLTSASKVRDEEVNRSPLILSPAPYEFLYQFPIKARITTNQKQEFYYYKKKDGLFFCPKENEATVESEYEEDDITMGEHTDEFTYQNYCLFEKKFKENEKKLCGSEVNPVIVEDKYLVGTNERGRCGETGYMYKVAYKVCLENSEKNMFNKLYDKLKNRVSQEYDTTTYEVCYDELQNRVLFAKHSILSPYILRNLNLDGERALHKLPQKYYTEIYGIKNLKKLENSVKAYEQQANTEDKQLLQMLVPTDDFALGYWMKTTFHIINYGFIHESKAPTWNAINSHVRSKVIKEIHEKNFDNPLIFTGTFIEKSVDENKDNLNLGNDQNSGIIIPKVWWKVVYSSLHNEAVVIIMHNDNDSKEICEKEETACEPTKWKTAQLKEKHFQFVYCCSLLSASESIPVLKDLVPGVLNPIYTRAKVLKLG